MQQQLLWIIGKVGGVQTVTPHKRKGADMARMVVLSGVPVDVAKREFTDRDGKDRESLKFRLHNSATAASGTYVLETTDEMCKKQIIEAADAGASVGVVCNLYPKRKETDGKPDDWVSVYARAVV